MEPKPNRLISEKSPYLLQHAYNPVDWHPWGPEAFSKALEENKPVFLSVGYSTCHWCHIMEHESFMDPGVAGLINETFVPIKVDREERPDIDNVYMSVCQMMTGSGGWPLTVFLTPEGKPFFSGTYIPKAGGFGRIGMQELIPRVKEIWNTRKESVISMACEVTEALQNKTDLVKGDTLGEHLLHKAYLEIEAQFDAENGGFGKAPKFPIPHRISFLLRYGKRFSKNRAFEMAQKTLEAMRCGGIYDQLGSGFHRYSTDAVWLVPHFEKMLYDQALLAISYTEAFSAMQREEYRKTCQEILDYVLREMTGPEGAFYSAEDADSEGEEGRFYLWNVQEMREALGNDEEMDFVAGIFNMEEAGNFIDPFTGEKTGTNILHLKAPHQEQTMDDLKAKDDFSLRLDTVLRKLLEYRNKRIHPHKDDKRLTDWNGLMIAALAQAGLAFQEPRYLVAATKAADFILLRMLTPGGRLLHRYRDEEAGIPAFADDYAFFIWGLITLFEASQDRRFLEAACSLNRDFILHFRDKSSGGFFFTADDSEELLIRQKEAHDGALPSGNSVAMMNLLMIGKLTKDKGLEDMAAALGRAFSYEIEQSPSAYSQLLSAVDLLTGQQHK